MKKIWQVIASPFVWFNEIFSDHGKASWGRVFGAITLMVILHSAYTGKPIPDHLMQTFEFLLVYTFGSKVIGKGGISGLIQANKGQAAAPEVKT